MDAAFTLWQKHMRKFVRSKMEIVATLFFPLVLMGLFGVAMRRVMGETLPGLDYLSYITPGILALTALTASVLGGATLLQERLSAIIREYLVAPVPRSSILLAVVGSGFTKALLQSAVILGLGLLLGVRPNAHLPGLALSLIAFFAFIGGFVGIAAAVAARAPSMEAYHSLIMLLNVPILFMSNALYPLDAMPLWLRLIALANPTTYLIDAMRAGLFGQAAELSLPLDLFVLVAFAALTLSWAGRSFRRVIA